ncbi:MAG: hypothetical protein CO029_03115 [Candidatus Magasanikbacteria bacterium CG_4_9_14_0_2_um_filter_41_10]|uniref:Uncharacterized protein n=1 Tax=Candidatus Magasanikbacteria bacterium CG_4_10_14_0_2_um_filter_41_31 TaxID=1974639 RepID=A0A2M7V630_9BACT|nr:MAG: hypothetical protein AUJ37_03180 [Candidatus Magasanikbacteria bacterium CG1_02_41_34]PIZ94093.1 MAG: hypothetical protein COX83_00220 [Candidatus Magasanikbacteria bacterium CG_4_10_14_0_2_um_filter_41_31]PJC53366.1 MAG: hypothetical protein CO029_03115 [Candidatus Magasanikbacteria bacterium CG_4_9_14_0_2_um_filter_41_10]
MRNILAKHILIKSLLLVGMFSLYVGSPVFAQTLSKDITTQIDAAGHKAGIYTTSTPAEFFGSFIQIILSITGMLFFVLLIYGGYVRMTAHGEDDRLKKSTKTMVAALLGLTIVLLSYAITKFVLPRIYNASRVEPVYQENNDSPNTIYQKSIDIKLF